MDKAKIWEVGTKNKIWIYKLGFCENKIGKPLARPINIKEENEVDTTGSNPNQSLFQLKATWKRKSSFLQGSFTGETNYS